jgi:hypothetical protein
LAFSTKLRQLCGPKTEVWRDHRIDGSDLLTPTIEANVRGARILLSVVSRSYLESNWCRAELRLFVEGAKATGGLRVGTKSRILKILKTPVDRAAEMKAEIDISDVIGYPFFRDTEDGKHWEYDPVLGQEAREEFLRHVVDLAHDTKALLDALAGGQPDAHPLLAATGIVVYLAETADDMAGDADRLRRELRMLGHTVLPEAPYRHGAEYGDRARADLARAHIVIHPIAKGLGPMPESLDRRIVPLQYDLARGTDASARVVWMPADAQIAEIADEALRQALDADPAVRKCTLESIKSAIATFVQRLLEPPAPVPPPTGAERTQIYLVFDQEDAERARPIAAELFAHGFTVTLPLFDGDEGERRVDHDESLRDCNAVLIFHCSATDFWRRAKVRDLKRAFAYGRQRPFLARGLVLAGAAATPASDNLDPDLIVLREPGAFDPAVLAPFLEALNRSKGATA